MPATTTRPILVTGASGSLGRRVTATLLERGHGVTAVDLPTDPNRRLASRLQDHPASGALALRWVDITDRASVAATVAEADPAAIVHLAAVIPPLAYRNPELARRVNVEGTANLLAAADELGEPPMFIEASSTAVYGSRNPTTVSGPLRSTTVLDPIDNYGAHKVACEQLVAGSGLPHAVLRIGAIVMPELVRSMGADRMFIEHAIPGDARVHAVDVRDAGAAFATAAELGPTLDGKVLLIGGDETTRLTHRTFTDGLLDAVGVGALGPTGSRPGNPTDDQGWFLTDWMDTAEAQELLSFQDHTWDDTLASIRDEVGALRPLCRLVGPVARSTLRLLARRQRAPFPGEHAVPWTMLATRFGPSTTSGWTTR